MSIVIFATACCDTTDKLCGNGGQMFVSQSWQLYYVSFIKKNVKNKWGEKMSMLPDV